MLPLNDCAVEYQVKTALAAASRKAVKPILRQDSGEPLRRIAITQLQIG